MLYQDKEKEKEKGEREEDGSAYLSCQSSQSLTGGCWLLPPL